LNSSHQNLAKFYFVLTAGRESLLGKMQIIQGKNSSHNCCLWKQWSGTENII